MANDAKVRYCILFTEETLTEIQNEAVRLEGSLSSVVHLAWSLCAEDRRTLSTKEVPRFLEGRPSWVKSWLERRSASAPPRDGLCPQSLYFEGEDFAELSALAERYELLPDEIVAWAWSNSRARVSATSPAS